MPSEHRRRWMRAYQRKRRAEALKASVVALLHAGLKPVDIGRPQTVKARLAWLLRDRRALQARIGMQSGGIKGLREEVATLKALLATQPAMEERALKAELLATQQKLALLEADILMQRAEAILDDHLREAAEEYTWEPRERMLREEP